MKRNAKVFSRISEVMHLHKLVSNYQRIQLKIYSTYTITCAHKMHTLKTNKCRMDQWLVGFFLFLVLTKLF